MKDWRIWTCAPKTAAPSVSRNSPTRGLAEAIRGRARVARVEPSSNRRIDSRLKPTRLKPLRPPPSQLKRNQLPLDPEAEAKRAARQRDREVKAILRQLIDELIAYYASDDRGVEIREIAGGYRMATKPECHDAVRMFIKSLKPAMKLSLPALETLAVIAYKQPVTAPEVNEIRGVDSSGVFGSLLARKLITTAGRKQVIGRPILYKTTKEFLMRFGLKDVAELPSMDEFEKMASELEEVEPAASSTKAMQQPPSTKPKARPVPHWTKTLRKIRIPLQLFAGREDPDNDFRTAVDQRNSNDEIRETIGGIAGTFSAQARACRALP